ncbi:flagellar brake protein [Alicyclobacillus curvatus]|nr:flagellar brake protein [Alicyclobacillus curvatus]
MPLPTVGQALRVRTSQDTNGYFRSRLTDISSDGLIIEPPLAMDGRPLFPMAGESFWVEFHAIDGAICFFRSTFVALTETPTPAWVVTRPQLADVHRQQRREFVRVEVEIPVRLEASRGGGMQMWEVRSKDLSGGGIGLWLPKTAVLQAGSTVYCKFTLPRDDFPIDTQGVVVRVGERNDNGYGVASIQFLKMRENIRQRIIQFTFWRQRFLSSLSEDLHHS